MCFRGNHKEEMERHFIITIHLLLFLQAFYLVTLQNVSDSPAHTFNEDWLRQENLVTEEEGEKGHVCTPLSAFAHSALPTVKVTVPRDRRSRGAHCLLRPPFNPPLRVRSAFLSPSALPFLSALYCQGCTNWTLTLSSPVFLESFHTFGPNSGYRCTADFCDYICQSVFLL